MSDRHTCAFTHSMHPQVRSDTRAHVCARTGSGPIGAASSPPGRPRPWKHPSGVSQRHPCLRTESRSCPPPRKSTSNGHRPGFPQNQTTGASGSAACVCCPRALKCEPAPRPTRTPPPHAPHTPFEDQMRPCPSLGPCLCWGAPPFPHQNVLFLGVGGWPTHCFQSQSQPTPPQFLPPGALQRLCLLFRHLWAPACPSHTGGSWEAGKALPSRLPLRVLGVSPVCPEWIMSQSPICRKPRQALPGREAAFSSRQGI